MASMYMKKFPDFFFQISSQMAMLYYLTHVRCPIKKPTWQQWTNPEYLWGCGERETNKLLLESFSGRIWAILRLLKGKPEYYPAIPTPALYLQEIKSIHQIVLCCSGYWIITHDSQETTITWQVVIKVAYIYKEINFQHNIVKYFIFDNKNEYERKQRK